MKTYKTNEYFFKKLLKCSFEDDRSEVSYCEYKF
uniref:Uncharacterized protein n=1 Tax=Siphoviridae sp. ctwQT14 TaxID=2827971 RepID=A0A8S5TKK1_9CAUD|nr:MAG TPA: hypothetical protein [Siphoviridae sp. ctwQT14]